MIVQFQRTCFSCAKVNMDEYIKYDFYEFFDEGYQNLIYQAEKCNFDQQGGFLFEREIDKLFYEL